jgi:ribonuclease HII
MAFLIGVDEAGYGPNLGPLVVAATVWQIPDQPSVNLYSRLADGVCHEPGEADQRRVAIADSKLLYKPRGSLANLERAIYPILGCLQQSVQTWQKAWSTLAPDSRSQRARLPWYAEYDEIVPIDLDVDAIRILVEPMNELQTRCGIKLTAIRSTAIFPECFNQLITTLGNKSNLLSDVTLKLVRDLLAECPGQRAKVNCDKHGGRNQYAGMLHGIFPETLARVHEEGRAVSQYDMQIDSRQVSFRFSAKGERFLESALASMVAKYLRELAMRAFNAYWCSRVERLRPTAGYPVDAKRFFAEISAAADASGIARDHIWRCR